MTDFTQNSLLNAFLNKVEQEAPSEIITKINGLDLTFEKLSDDEARDEESLLEYSFDIKGENHIFQLIYFSSYISASVFCKS